jgi:hypothetical protein
MRTSPALSKDRNRNCWPSLAADWHGSAKMSLAESDWQALKARTIANDRLREFFGREIDPADLNLDN